ncbi:hypothetical protein RJT34_12080 [Clitoria ternatea]|uniref:VQ domain-containing protein n=1 Tax=Clitoria ternatea TaxID=43366 RepID=A0AAN9PKL8_CLITE
MDSGNSGSISSSGDEEYDSRGDHHTLLPSSPFLNQFGSISHPSHPSLPSHYQHHPSLFDLSPTYLHALSQSQHQPNPSFLHLDTPTSSQPRRSESDCTDPARVSSSTPQPQTLASSTTQTNINQCLLGPPLGTDNARVVLSSSQPNNAVARNSKKRTRASRRAPTTVLTTDTSNFRAMVQEFTGIPAPPFSASSSYSRRLDLLTGSSSLRSSSSLHLDTTIGGGGGFYPLRPSPQKLQHHQNPLLLSSSSPSSLLHNNMVDAIASTTTTTTPNNNNSSSNNNPINFQQQQLPHDLGLPYQNIMLSMQNHPTLGFHPSPLPLHPFGNNIATGFTTKLPSIEDHLGMSMTHGQVHNANFVASGVTVPHVNSEGVALRSTVNDDGGGGRVDGGASCKLNFSAASASTSLNHEKSTLENNNNNNNNNSNSNNATTRGEGTVDSWICSSD